MKIAYWSLLAIGVAVILYSFFGNNVRWLNFVGVGVVLVAGAFNPKRPFYGLRKQR